mmetsp:Transcript_28629/g.64578  ORF Transcript_28629/g.64578 Transcript_28629/m.64578 type:complete len:143 (-) Transcript_28629:64-492(-)
MDEALAGSQAFEDVAGRLNDTDRFVILLNVIAAVFGSFVYYLLYLRQRQGDEKRASYSAGPFVSLAEASHTWKVYRQWSSKTERDMHVCNFCGFAIKASPGEALPSATPPREPSLAEDAKANSSKEGLKQRKNIKKGKKGSG